MPYGFAGFVAPGSLSTRRGRLGPATLFVFGGKLFAFGARVWVVLVGVEVVSVAAAAAAWDPGSPRKGGIRRWMPSRSGVVTLMPCPYQRCLSWGFRAVPEEELTVEVGVVAGQPR